SLDILDSAYRDDSLIRQLFLRPVFAGTQIHELLPVNLYRLAAQCNGWRQNAPPFRDRSWCFRPIVGLNPLVTVSRASCKRARVQSAEYLNGKCAQAHPNPRVRTLGSRGWNSGLGGPHFIPGPVRYRGGYHRRDPPTRAGPNQPRALSSQLAPRTRR